MFRLLAIVIHDAILCTRKYTRNTFCPERGKNLPELDFETFEFRFDLRKERVNWALNRFWLVRLSIFVDFSIAKIDIEGKRFSNRVWYRLVGPFI